MTKCGNFVKIIGLKFDVIEGLEIVVDKNAKNYEEAGAYADSCNDDNTIFIAIPCSYTYKK